MGEYAQMFETALTMEKRVCTLQESLKEYDAQKAAILNEDPPPAPVCPTLSAPTEPTIQTSVKFNIWIAVLPCVVLILLLGLPIGPVLSVCWVALYYFVFYKMRKNKEEDKVRATAAFQEEQVAKSQEFQRGQEVVNERHAMEMEQYQNETLPAFAAQKQARLDEMGEKIREANEELAATTNELAAFYEQVGVIPEVYRNIEALEYMCRVLARGEAEPQQLYAWYEEALQQQRDEEARKQQQNSEMFKSVALFAAGAAAGAVVGTIATSKPSGPSQEDIASGKGRQNLYGSHICIIGKKDDHGFTNMSCMTCPAKPHCTQQGKYPLGS